MPRKAVLLLNLGSPDSTQVSDVRRYLRQFLMDERVINTRAWVRWMVVHLAILPRRPIRSAEAYSRVWTEEGSPLIVTSRRFRDRVAEKSGAPVYLGMRYGNPSTDAAIEQAKADGIDELLIVPLYPHYAMSSYESALVCATDAIARLHPGMRYEVVQPFYRDADYIDALLDQSEPYLKGEWDYLLFSFHGIPESHLRMGDPSHAHCLCRSDCCEVEHPAHATCYRHQCFETVRAFVRAAGIPADKYGVSFQSRLGREPWLRPYTDQILESLPSKGVKKLLVICPAFVTDCLETLEEIAMEGKETFLGAGGESFAQIPCLNLNERWIEWMVSRIRGFETAQR